MSKNEIEEKIESIEAMIEAEAETLYTETGEYTNDRIEDLKCRKMALEAMVREAE